MKCTVTGCTNKINSDGLPEQYCDYQQGRCPMQRRATLTDSEMKSITWYIVVLTVIAFWTYLIIEVVPF
jgi:hypothetical protein